MQSALRLIFITALLYFGVLVNQVSYAGAIASANTSADTQKLKVVASFSILADMARAVGGDYVDVYALVGAGEDVHVYQPRPRDARLLAAADVLIVNGLGFEGWIERLILASGYQGLIVSVSKDIPLLIADLEDSGEVLNHDTNDHGSFAQSDPHAWQSINNAKVYINNITQAYIALDEQHRDDYVSMREGYHQQLDQLQEDFVDELSRIPVEKRKLLTSHRAYRYFESAYGIEFFAAQGVNTKSAVSAKDLADMIRLIRTENITAALFERNSNRRLLDLITRETQCVIAGSLYADSLSASDGPASTYLAMMRYNLTTILSVLLAHMKA